MSLAVKKNPLSSLLQFFCGNRLFLGVTRTVKRKLADLWDNHTTYWNLKPHSDQSSTTTYWLWILIIGLKVLCCGKTCPNVKSYTTLSQQTTLSSSDTDLILRVFFSKNVLHQMLPFSMSHLNQQQQERTCLYIQIWHLLRQDTNSSVWKHHSSLVTFSFRGWLRLAQLYVKRSNWSLIHACWETQPRHCGNMLYSYNRKPWPSKLHTAQLCNTCLTVWNARKYNINQKRNHFIFINSFTLS